MPPANPTKFTCTPSYPCLPTTPRAPHPGKERHLVTSAPPPGTAGGLPGFPWARAPLQHRCPDLTYFLMANTVSPMVAFWNCASRMVESKTPSQMMGANQGVMTSTSALLGKTRHTVLERGVDTWATEGKHLSKGSQSGSSRARSRQDATLPIQCSLLHQLST